MKGKKKESLGKCAAHIQLEGEVSRCIKEVRGELVVSNIMVK